MKNQGFGWGDEANAGAWYRFISGHAPDFPEQVLQSTYCHTARRYGGGVVLHLVNLDPMHSAAVVVRAGNFGEHLFSGVTDLASGDKKEMNGSGLRVELGPGASLRARIHMQRFARQPHYPLLVS